MKCNVNIPKACPFCGRQLQQEGKDFALLNEQSKPIGKFRHIYWRHPTASREPKAIPSRTRLTKSGSGTRGA